MRVDPSTEKIMQQRTGLVPMATSTGLAAFYKGLALGADQVMVLEGDTAQLRRLFGFTPSTDKQAASPVTHDEGARSDEPFYQRLSERILNGELSAEQVEKLLLTSE